MVRTSLYQNGKELEMELEEISHVTRSRPNSNSEELEMDLRKKHLT